jgi:hypothetical protein
MAVTGQNSSRGSIVSGSSIIAAGIASALAAAVTSSMGWAGGLIGAALTTMIITGGSAILNAYLQSAKSRVQAAPGNIRAATQRVRPQGRQGRVDAAPGAGGSEASRGSLAERLPRALGWFSRLPAHQRSSILKRGLIGAGVAFVIGVLAITALEYGIGNSLSCGIWSNCPATSAPGFNGGNAYTASGSRGGYSLLGGHSITGGVNSQASPYDQQGGGGFFGGGQQTPQPVQPQGGGGFFGGGQQSPQQPVQPAPQQPAPQQPAPQQPVPQQPVPQQPAQPTPAEPATPNAPQ